MLSALLVHGARSPFFSLFIRNASILVRILDVRVLAVAFATLFYTSWHPNVLLSIGSENCPMDWRAHFIPSAVTCFYLADT
jgi:hypothetical protein